MFMIACCCKSCPTHNYPSCAQVCQQSLQTWAADIKLDWLTDQIESSTTIDNIAIILSFMTSGESSCKQAVFRTCLASMLSCNSWWATLHWDSTASCTASQHISSCLTRGHRAASAWLDACAEFADPPHGAALQSTRPWRGRRHTTSSDVLESDTHAAGSHTIQTGSRLPLLQLFPIRGQDTSTCQPIRLFCRRPPRLLLLSLSASAVILNLPRPPLVLLSSSSLPLSGITACASLALSPSLSLQMLSHPCLLLLQLYLSQCSDNNHQVSPSASWSVWDSVCVRVSVCMRTSCWWITLNLELFTAWAVLATMCLPRVSTLHQS